MRHSSRIAGFAFLALLGAALSFTPAFADDPGAGGNTGVGAKALSFCAGLLPGGTNVSNLVSFVGPIAQCFTDSTKGIIPAMTNGFLQATQSFYIPIVGALFMMSIMFFGYRLVLGDVQDVKASTFTFLFKVAGVFYFMYNAPLIYSELMAIVSGLTSMADTAVVSAANAIGSPYCGPKAAAAQAATGGSDPTAGVWGMWDCILGGVFGFSTSSVTWGIGGFLFLAAASKGSGLLLLVIGLYFMMTLFFTLVRFIHIYLISLLGMSFSFCLGYLFVPLILFKHSYGYFQRWLTLVISLMLTPVIVFAFMGMMLIALDVALFKGDYAMWATVQGVTGSTAPTGSSNPPPDAFGKAMGCTGSGGNTALNCDLTQQPDNFKGILFLNWGNSITSSTTNNASPTAKNACAGDDANPAAPTAPTAPAADPVSGALMNMGILGKLKDVGVKGSSYVKNHPASASYVGLDMKGLALACGPGGGAYITKVLTSFVGAALLVYIMYSLLGYIPKLASDISSQGGYLGIAGLVADTQVFGASTANDALSGIRSYASKLAGGGREGGAAGNFLSQTATLVTRRGVGGPE